MEDEPTQVEPQPEAPMVQQLDGERVDPAKDEGQIIHLPALISDEFGTSRSIVREQILLGMIEIDGEPWKGDRFDIPRDEIVGKTITVKGRDRSFRLDYKG